MNKQVIREALELAQSSAHSARTYDIMVKALAELDAPAPQSAREVIEKLADIEHERWSGQARTALFEMTDERRERWTRLIDIPYAKLDKHNKELDRMQVMEYWPLIEAYAESRVQEAVEKVKQEAWKWFCGTGREDNFPARYDRLSDSIDIAMRESKP